MAHECRQFLGGDLVRRRGQVNRQAGADPALCRGEHDHPVAGNAQKKASAGVDLALGLLLPAVGALAAADRLHGQRPQPVPAGDGQPGKPEKEKKDSWAARVLAEPRLGLTILVGARAMLETCGSAGRDTDVKEGVPSR